MPEDTLRMALDAYAELPFDGKLVSFQGGEPLMPAGATLLKIADEYPFAKSLQTNATLITEEIAAQLACGGWLAGASLDGPPNMNRLRGDSFDDAVRGIRLLERHGVEYNIMTVVSKANVSCPREIYRYFRDNFKTRFHQYIECTGPRDAISGEEWGRFLTGLFDEWILHDAHEISVRLFDSIVSQIIRGTPTQCSFGRSCRQHLVIEHDGSVYPCDFHVSYETCLGNIRTHSLAEIAESPKYRAFAEAKVKNLPQKCEECPYMAFCNGDCPRSNRTLCEGWKMFFDHSLKRFQELAAEAMLNL